MKPTPPEDWDVVLYPGTRCGARLGLLLLGALLVVLIAALTSFLLWAGQFPRL